MMNPTEGVEGSLAWLLLWSVVCVEWLANYGFGFAYMNL